MDKRVKAIPKLVHHKTSPVKEEGACKAGSCFSYREQKDPSHESRFRASTPASSGFGSVCKFDSKLDDGSVISAFHESEQDVENVKSKIPATTLSKRLDEQSFSVDVIQARYVQALYMDIMMKNYINQHRKDETTYLAQLSLLVSNLSDHLAYLERMSMAARHQKEVKEVIRRQEMCLDKVKRSLECSMEPFKKLMEAIDSTRHNIQFEGINLDQEELNKLSSNLDKASSLLQQLIQVFSSCNLMKSSQAYTDLEAALQKGVDLLKHCREHTHALENAVIESSSVRIQILHKPSK